MSNLPSKASSQPTLPIISKQWDLAWEEFGRRYPRLKHGPAALAFFLFTFLGQSVLGILSVFVFLPWFAWLLMFLCTSVAAQMFVLRFAGKAHERLLAESEAKLTALTEHKLVFELFDGTTVRVEDHGSDAAGRVVWIYVTLELQFETYDQVQTVIMKDLSFNFYRSGDEIFNWWSILRYSSHGAPIDKKHFEGMGIQPERKISPRYTVEALLTIADDRIKRAADIEYSDYITVTMRASGHQEPLTASLHPHWAEASELTGTRQITVTGVNYTPKDYRRIG